MLTVCKSIAYDMHSCHKSNTRNIIPSHWLSFLLLPSREQQPGVWPAPIWYQPLVIRAPVLCTPALVLRTPAPVLCTLVPVLCTPAPVLCTLVPVLCTLAHVLCTPTLYSVL